MLKKKSFKVLLAAVLMFAAGGVYAFDSEALAPYFAVKMGVSDLHGNLEIGDTYDLNSNQAVFLFGASIGTKYKSLRADFDYLYRSADNLDYPANGKNYEGKHEVQTYLVSLYYDFMSDKMIYPYFGAGIGWSDVYADFSNNTKDVRSATLFTYAFSAGLVYNLNDYIDFDLGYRYTKIADKDLKIAGVSGTFIEYANELTLAARYKF